MKNNVTELVFILDRSGSMAGLESDTIGGFNALIEKQKREEGKCFVTTVLFDSESRMIHDREPLESIPKMTENDYTPHGCTALIDAIGKTIKHVSDIHKYARPEDVPEHTVFVITTDGLENASHVFTSDEVKKAVERQKTEKGWEFLFIGANIDSVETARGFGIGEDRAVNYHADKKGTKVLYEAVAESLVTVRKSKPLGENWKDRISEDYESRKGE